MSVNDVAVQRPTTTLPDYETLTPTSFLDRSAYVFADRVAVIDGDVQFSYAQFQQRCLKQAGVLRDLGVDPGDRVAVLAPNGHLTLESHFGVLYAGGVLVTLNTRLSAKELAFIVDHAGCKVVLYAHELAELMHTVMSRSGSTARIVADGDEYERLLARAAPNRVQLGDERALMSLNYTSGTTGAPKGVMYHHRGAYLQALAMNSHFRLTCESVYLWTLPMFHCNGWAFTWAVTAAGGTHLCLPRIEPELVWRSLREDGVTHLCAAPTVLLMIIHHEGAAPLDDRTVTVAVGGAPPTPTLLERCSELSLDVTHLYGLTETFGPVAVCDWRPEWTSLSIVEQALRRARQGVGTVVSCRIKVIDAQGQALPRDGQAVGEICVRGNNVMLGYFRDEYATREAMPDSWFRTGDLGVVHPDGYLELRDRLKDVIISGGENISSVEVEAALASHPAVLEAAVVAAPDEHWGERPAAWVTLKDGATVTAGDLKHHVGKQLARFKVPDRIEFGELPKTASGKVRKVQLREAARQQ